MVNVNAKIINRSSET